MSVLMVSIDYPESCSRVDLLLSSAGKRDSLPRKACTKNLPISYVFRRGDLGLHAEDRNEYH